MQLPKYRAWIKPQKRMVKVSNLSMESGEEGIEYLENGQKIFVPMIDCEVQQSINITDHSGNEYYFYDVILKRPELGFWYCVMATSDWHPG